MDYTKGMVTLAAVASVVNPTMRAAWSVALALVISSTPHTLSIQASNAGYGKVLYVADSAVVADVHMVSYRFAPDSVVIHVGEAVRWTNSDHVKHTITFEGDEEGSPFVADGATFTHRFEKPGVYRYHCRPHSYMKGVVVVR